MVLFLQVLVRPSPVSPSSEIGEQVENLFYRVTTDPPPAHTPWLLLMVVFQVTLATCTLLFWLLLYSQYYKFSVEFFCNFVAF